MNINTNLKMDRASLPQVVNAVGDRIRLDYTKNRKKSTSEYVEEASKYTRMDQEWLNKSYYALSENKTKVRDKSKDNKNNFQRHVAKNPLKLNAKLRKQLYKLTQEEKKSLTYSVFEQVHELWLSYATEILKIGDAYRWYRTDLHGCKLKCSASKNPTLVGVEGIVVQETQNTFIVITTTNRVITLPKRDSLFEFQVHNQTYRIHGYNLLYTPQMRSKDKVKQKKYKPGI